MLLLQQAGTGTLNITYTKGTLASRDNKYMFWNGNTPSVESTQTSTESISFYYYNTYNAYTHVSRTGCYKYSK